MRIHSQVLDFYDDATREGLQKIASPGELGGLSFAVMTPTELRALHDDQFALVVLTKEGSALRKFPVHDAPHAFLAGQYLALNMHKLAEPARVIAAYHVKVAADSYGAPIPADVSALAAEYPEEMTGNAFIEGSEVHYPTEAPIVKEAGVDPVRWFEENVDDIEPSQRHEVAAGILKEAHAAGAMPESAKLLKYASASWNPRLDAHLEMRALLLPRNEAAREILEKLAAQIGKVEPQEFAHVLETFDAKTGVDRYYGRGLTDAYDSTLGHEKRAWSDEIDGETITREDLIKAAGKPSFKSYFGETVKNAFVKDPVSIYESLPTPNKALIAQIARGEA